MFFVGYGIYSRAELPSVYFITNTKQCVTYLNLTQLFAALLTSRFHILKYTHYVAFCCVPVGVCHV